jgi:ribose transport system substrate-binding protein
MYRSRTLSLVIASLFIVGMVLGACTPAAPATQPTSAPAATNVPAASSFDADAALKALETTVSGTGPNGEKADTAASVTLTDAELEQIKGMGATAAIVMHYGGNDWSSAQIAGLKDQFTKMGIEVIAVTDANFKPEKQVSDLETVLAKKPDIIVSIPTDPVATADAYRKAVEQGVKLVFMDNIPSGFTPGVDYVSLVSADNYGNGVASGLLMGKTLNGQGKIGLIYHAADFFVTQQRYNGFKTTITENFPGIEIVEEQGIGGPDFAGDAEKAASAMLTKYPDLNGIWAVWDVPAEGVMAALRSADRSDVVVITQDLGTNVAVEMAKDGVIKGLGAQRPFDQGVTEALLAGYALLGKQAPAYVALYALPVTHDNVLEAWKTVYHADPPADLATAFGAVPVEPVFDADAALKALETTVSGTGPNGEKADTAASVTLTDAELEQIKGMGATAAIVMHYGGNDWSSAQIAGLKDQFTKMGIEVIAVTDANFKPEKQVSDLETVLAKKPDIIVSIPTDPVATADAYRKAVEQGVKLVFMDNIPSGFTPGVDYVSLVSADNYGNGVASGLLMGKTLNGQGKIGLIYHAADFFVTQQRYNGFKTTITENFPGIEIVEEQGIGGPDFAGDAEKAASAMLTKYPDLNGIWAVWDVPAEGVMAALRSADRSDVVVITQDLGTNVAVEMAKDGVIKGLGAQRPFDQGVTEALLAGYALLGKQAPAYVALYALPVTHDNVLEAWKTVYHADPPADLANAYAK